MCLACVEKGKITREVYAAILSFDDVWCGSPSYGPAHIVIGDMNVRDEHIQWCLDHWNEYEDEDPEQRHERREEYEATKKFLTELLTWPIERRMGALALNGEVDA